MSIIRVSNNGLIFLLASGEIATNEAYCKPNIFLYTDDMQHPGCVELKIEGATYKEVEPLENTSKAYCVDIVQNINFKVYARWQSGHNPYPEIITMRAILCGVDIPETNYPKAPDDYKLMANVEVDENLNITVNGKRGKF